MCLKSDWLSLMQLQKSIVSTVTSALFGGFVKTADWLKILIDLQQVGMWVGLLLSSWKD